MAAKSYKSQEIKLKKVLNIFLQEDFKASDDVYLEKVISHLSGKFDKELGKHLLDQTICREWIENALQKWENSKPHHSVVAFCINVASLIINGEEEFKYLNENGSVSKIIDLIKIYEQKSPAVKLSYIHFQNALIQHSTGLQFVFNTGIWKDVLNFAKENKTLYVVRESNIFIYNILVITSKQGKDLYDFKDILKMVLIAVTEQKWTEENNIMPIGDSLLYKTLSPTLNLLNFILEEALKNNEMGEVIRYMLIEYKLEWHYWNLLSVTFDEAFLKIVIRMTVLIIFSKLRFGTDNSHSEITKEDLSDFCANSYNIMNIVIVSKRLPLRALQICELYHLIWYYIKKNASDKDVLSSNEVSANLESQLNLLQLTPILVAIKSTKSDSHIFFEEYVMKLFNIAGEHTTRLIYAYRDSLKGCSGLYDVANQAILSLLSTKSLLEQDRVILIFQAFFYILKDFVPEASVFPIPENYLASEIISRAPHLLGTILTALCTLIKDFKISWFETIESTAIVKFSLALLANTNLSTKLNIQALQLTQLGIEKYMVLTLALLLDRIEGSGMDQLGPTIAKKLHDPQWEVRDSTLELLQSVSIIAKCKFPAFQKHILASNLVSLVCIIAETDGESYVRASAWKCIKNMLRINSFWTECLQHQNLLSKLKEVIINDEEAVVRQEAILTLVQLTERLNIIPTDIYNIMKHIAIHDLHWEVQTNALAFWKAAIQKECHNQGMIDGAFPPVTFSRESHKIVNLDDIEIRKRLRLILNALSENGCLEVFVNCLNENSELRVLQEVVDTIKELTNLLKKYNFTKSMVKQDTNEKISVIGKVIDKIDVEKNQDKEDSTTDPISSDSVIDSIVNLDDVNLLSNVYNNQMTIKSVNLEEFPTKIISAHEFLSYLETFQVDEKIKIKDSWLLRLSNDFENLLDDILCCHGEENTSNDMDCY